MDGGRGKYVNGIGLRGRTPIAEKKTAFAGAGTVTRPPEKSQ